MLLDLVNNVALLISLSVFYGSFLNLRKKKPILSQLLIGLWFGIVAVLGMIVPFEYQNGAIFDGRSIVLSLAGLFGGGVSAVIAVVISAAYRIYIGGAGIWAGLATIVLSAMVGLYFRKVNKAKPEKINYFFLFGIGVIVHIIMLLCQLLFPWNMVPSILGIIWKPVIIVFPIAFMFMGVLLGNEEKRYKALDQFRQLFENHKAVHLLIDPETSRIANANKAAAKFYGYSVEELKTMYISQLNILNEEELKQEINRALRKNQLHFEFKHRLSNGIVKDVEVFSSVIEIEGKSFLYSIIHDITEKKLLFEEIIKAKEKAEESDRLKSAFLANMSHEIRTPLNAILGFTGLLTEDNIHPKEIRDNFSLIINRSAENLLNIINDILDLSKLETDQLVLNNKSFPLNHTLKVLHSLYLKKLEDKGKKDIVLKLLPAKSKVILYNDENRISQILINLLDNAIKFTQKGQISFGIKEITTDKIQLFVSDTGIGIPKDKHTVIFNRFAQAEIDTSRKYGGTGLGLSIVKKLVSIMNGTIELESEPGKGTSFTIELPYQKDIPLGETPQNLDELPAKNNFSVLIVEDDESSLLYYLEILKDTGIKIHKATSGEDALIMYYKFKPDVILLDIRLPDINGLEIAKEIRKTDRKVRIIALTAYAMQSNHIEAIEAGCNDYISKPVTHSVLLKKLNQAYNV